MKIVKNLYMDKPTYFIGKIILNGCQSFRIEDIDKVRSKFEFDVERVKDIYKTERKTHSSP